MSSTLGVSCCLVSKVILVVIASLSITLASSSQKSHHHGRQRRRLNDNIFENRFNSFGSSNSSPLSYQLLSSREIHQTLLDWKVRYPRWIRVFTSQQEFGLSRAGTRSDCPFDGNNNNNNFNVESSNNGCFNYFAILQDYQFDKSNNNKEEEERRQRLPTVLLSGALHGDERVGPTAVMETTFLLLQTSACIQQQQQQYTAGNHTIDLSQCREFLNQLHPSLQRSQDNTILNFIATTTTTNNNDDDSVRFLFNNKYAMWLYRLITTRKIIIVPTANALGYYRRQRTEQNNVDPNRDFPFDIIDPTKCMQTIAARTLNEIFRRYLIQLAFTYHGGVELIGYEWGAPTWFGYSSPDDVAQHELAAAFSNYGGGFQTTTSSRGGSPISGIGFSPRPQGNNVDQSTSTTWHPPYKFGPTNDLLYHVRGGMEDWAYAGSWDRNRVITCKPPDNDYPEERTRYNNSTLRAFNMLVETSLQKTPRGHALGRMKNILDASADNPFNGHIPRNIRLALSAIDLVQPYVVLTGVNDLILSKNRNIFDNYCRRQQQQQQSVVMIISVPKPTIRLEWSVAGALQIDETVLWIAKYNDDLFNDWPCDDSNRPSSRFTQIDSTLQYNGTGSFSLKGSRPLASPTIQGGTHFSATIDVDPSLEGWVVMASARVDSIWQQQDSTIIGPNVPPQSHIVQARTNPNWNHKSKYDVIEGRTLWFSMPIRLIFYGNNSATTLINNKPTTGAFRRPRRPTRTNRQRLGRGRGGAGGQHF